MNKITIEVFLDSGANHESCYRASFEIDEDEWNAMSDDEKDYEAQQVAWDRTEWGWSIKEKK